MTRRLLNNDPIDKLQLFVCPRLEKEPIELDNRVKPTGGGLNYASLPDTMAFFFFSRFDAFHPPTFFSDCPLADPMGDRKNMLCHLDEYQNFFTIKIAITTKNKYLHSLVVTKDTTQSDDWKTQRYLKISTARATATPSTHRPYTNTKFVQ